MKYLYSFIHMSGAKLPIKGLRIQGDSEEEYRDIEVEERVIDGRKYLVSQHGEVFKMGEGYDKIGILNEDNAIISLPTSTRSLRDITSKDEETTQYCKYERVVLNVTGHDETSRAQLEKGFSTKAVCSGEHLRSAEASWRTFKGVANARHDQTMLNLLMLRDAVERKLYERG